MKKKKTLPTGEFARLCKTTKATLFHYDQEGLLKPRYVSENGYRHYGVEQFFDFDMISMLKETGSSLKEIRAYLRNADQGDFLALLEEKRMVVKKERKKLAQRELMIRDMATCTREALAFTYDTFMIREQEEERLEAVPTESAETESISEFVARFVEYTDFYETQDKIPRYPFGIIIYQEDTAQGRYRERFFFSRATRSTPPAQLHVKPAGIYAVFAHQGTTETHMRVFEELPRLVSDAGLSVAGNAYVYDMMSYILQGAGATYACKYCVRLTDGRCPEQGAALPFSLK